MNFWWITSWCGLSNSWHLNNCLLLFCISFDRIRLRVQILWISLHHSIFIKFNSVLLFFWLTWNFYTLSANVLIFLTLYIISTKLAAKLIYFHILIIFLFNVPCFSICCQLPKFFLCHDDVFVKMVFSSKWYLLVMSKDLRLYISVWTLTICKTWPKSKTFCSSMCDPGNKYDVLVN